MTTAQEKLRSAKELMAQAYKDLLTVLDEDTWGYDDYSSDFIDEVQEIAMQILILKRKL